LDRSIGGYRTLRQIGRGAQGAVYQARCEDGGSGPATAALKISIAPGTSAAEVAEFKARIQRECATPSRVHSPYLLRYFGVGDINETTCYLIMEYIEGGLDLHKWSEAFPAEPGLFLDILRKVAQGLAKAHAAAILHRDLKPENILLTPDLTPKIADFGCALDTLRTRLTQGDKSFGTPIFMAPEICCQQDALPASDQYSLGVIAYAYLNGGRVPHREALDHPDFAMAFGRFLAARIQEPAAPIEGLSQEVNQCLGRMLQRLPENRYPNVEIAFDQLVCAFSGSHKR
jgi:serine/threonine-protein kinase